MKNDKKQSKVHWGGLFALLLTVMMGCSVASNGSNGTTVSSANTTPDVATLDAITNTTDASGKTPYVYWRVARTFAMIELESFRQANDWYNAKLSERPVLVYDGKSRPKYYEFRVIRDGKEIGAITAVAQKVGGKPVHSLRCIRVSTNRVWKLRKNQIEL